ncbi:Platelet-activating factor acetylhydrolase [Globomyces sp. JEL0801]|nr:Platelet-activating factor acetylhydrolase [Globomyces sp. JEL0801]
MFSPKKLPNYEGPYSVGYIDLESAPIVSNETLCKQGVLFRMFYPIEKHSIPKSLKEEKSHWMPLNKFYFNGYIDFLTGVPSFLSYLLLFPAMYSTRLSATFASPLLNSTNQDKFPIIIFSHGLAGMRTSYSTMCGNLASRGNIVISLEHGDGSACITQRLKSNIHKISYLKTRKQQKLYKTEEAIKKWRQSQLNFRCQEILETLNILKKLDNVDDDMINELVGDISPSKKTKNLTSHLTKEFLKQFQSKFDFDNIGLLGHSFGGATLLTLMNMPKVPNFKYSIILDPWMFPVEKGFTISIPTLTVQSSHFHWKDNLESMIDMVYKEKNNDNVHFAVIDGTRHDHCSDFGFIFNNLYSYTFYRGIRTAKEAHMIMHQLFYDFIIKNTIVDEGTLLEESSTLGDLEKYVMYDEDAQNLLDQYVQPFPTVP